MTGYSGGTGYVPITGSGGSGGGGVQTYATVSAFPATGQSNILYLALDTGIIYYWNGSAYQGVEAGAIWGAITGNINNQTDLPTLQIGTITPAITAPIITTNETLNAALNSLQTQIDQLNTGLLNTVVRRYISNSFINPNDFIIEADISGGGINLTLPFLSSLPVNSTIMSYKFTLMDTSPGSYLIISCRGSDILLNANDSFNNTYRTNILGDVIIIESQPNNGSPVWVKAP